MGDVLITHFYEALYYQAIAIGFEIFPPFLFLIY